MVCPDIRVELRTLPEAGGPVITPGPFAAPTQEALSLNAPGLSNQPQSYNQFERSPEGDSGTGPFHQRGVAARAFS